MKPIKGKPKNILEAMDKSIKQGMTKEQIEDWEREKRDIDKGNRMKNKFDEIEWLDSRIEAKGFLRRLDDFLEILENEGYTQTVTINIEYSCVGTSIKLTVTKK